jgi:aminopeptidase N
MKKFTTTLLLTLSLAGVIAQEKENAADTTWKSIYRYTAEKLTDLRHTKLDVRFDYDKSWLYGKAWITATPHFYPADSLVLDAKGMDIAKVTLFRGGQNAPLKFDHDGMILRVHLDKTYKKGEEYTVYIEYTAKPNEFEEKMGTQLLGVKGLYFINPKGEDKNEPTQIWTQGETESNSAWFPTIDKTNQRMTDEIIMTVPDKYVTLSNGKLISQKKNADGTRTDDWKMDLPHAPYLFFMGVGDYAVIKDSWRGKEVNYYVEKPYAAVAKRIFGNTPEMMTYFSRITGVDYPWVKYSQITGREYVAGAMENTTATLHQDNAQQDARELVDGNEWESTIAHELFHQWFGDLATTENWTNLTLNESFADYSQTLWAEYKYGKDAGMAENLSGMRQYLESQSEDKPLVRFHYASPEDMFDAVSYQKGGRILNMLRNHVGDSAFFKSLNLYLTRNKFKSTEAQDLRLAFEEVTGKDLNWFFNQWYYGTGHPKLDVNYRYDEATGTEKLIVKQTQKGQVFRIPTTVDIYFGAQRTRHQVWIESALDSFTFPVKSKPDLVNFDGDKVLLCEKKENKSLDNYIHQYTYAGNYGDRREAIDIFGRRTEDPKAVAMLLQAAEKDPYFGLRGLALSKLNLAKESLKQAAEPVLARLAANEPRSTVRGTAIGLLGSYKKDSYKPIFERAVNDSSYTVSGEALEALSLVDSAQAFTYADKFSKAPSKGKLDEAINSILIASGRTEAFDHIMQSFTSMGMSNEKFNILGSMGAYLGKLKDPVKVKQGVDEIVKFRESIPSNFRVQTDNYINNMVLKGIATQKRAAGLTEQAEYIESKLPKK